MKQRSQYLEIALTYPRRPKMWLGVGMYLPVIFGCAAAVLGELGSITHLEGPQVLIFAGWPSMMIAIHLKEQLVFARTRVMPGGQGLHLLVAAIALTLVGIVGPLILAWKEGFSFWGALACLVVAQSLIQWWAALQSCLITCIAMLLCFMVLNPKTATMFVPLLRNEVPAATWSLLAIGVLSFYKLGRRLYVLSEEDSEFHRPFNISKQDQRSLWTTAGRPELRRRYTENPSTFLMAPSPRLVEKMIALPAHSLWSRVRRRRVGVMLGRGSFVVWFCAALLINLPSFLVFLASSDRRPMAGSNQMILPMIWATLLPVMMIFQRVGELRPTIGTELLRPATKSHFLSELGISVAVEQVRAWLAMILAMAFYDGLTGWTLLASTNGLMMIVVNIASQVTLFGVGIWLLRYRSRLMVMAMFIGFILAVCMVLAMTHHLHQSLSAPWLAGIALLLLLIGAGLIFDARKRWLRTELG